MRVTPIASALLSVLLCALGSGARSTSASPVLQKRNNLVTELLHTTSSADPSAEYTFTRATEGWIFISLRFKGTGISTSTLDPASRQDAVIVHDAKDGPGDENAWSWGRLHTTTFRYPLAALGPAYAKGFNLGPVARPGDAHTPNAGTHNAKFEHTGGATYRHVLDLADWEQGLATSAPGQSGQPGSPHYADLLPLWQMGEYFPLAFSRARVEQVTRHRLNLKPAG